MRVLVTAASKHGSTAEIAETIAEVLRARGLETDLMAPERVDVVDGYDALVIGSAVYAGRWQKSARQLVDRISVPAGTPVWLFSSGPIGDPPAPTADPVDVDEIREETDAVAHRLFAGRLLQSALSFPERAIVSALRAEYGDFRDWDDIRAWANEIADQLSRPA